MDWLERSHRSTREKAKTPPPGVVRQVIRLNRRQSQAKPFRAEWFIAARNDVVAWPTPGRWRISPIRGRDDHRA